MWVAAVDCPVFVSPHGPIRGSRPTPPRDARQRRHSHDAYGRCGRPRLVLTMPTPPDMVTPAARGETTSVAVAAATDHRIVLDEGLPSVIRWIGLHVTGGQRGGIGRLAGPDGATGPVHRGLPVRRAGRGASRGRPVRRRGLLRPCWWDAPAGPAAGHATRPGGRRLDPLQGKTPGRGLRRGPRARADTPIEAAGATTGSVDHCFDSEM